jgi:7-carboxy-7-deazaguanine synthase
MVKDSLVISEKFYSIQGEGQTMGVPAIFVRLAGCNLLCKSKSWVCDSIEVWQKGTKTGFKDVLTPEERTKLKQGAHLIFTGGEPMLYQNKIWEYLQWFLKFFGFKPIIEIETNGTIIPSNSMLNIVNYWNCSPKLSNSGEPEKKRINKEALELINSRPNSIFKFVIFESSDVDEMINEYIPIIELDKVVLMPAGETREKLEKTRPIVINECLKLGVRYSERLHIVIWNQKTGV